MTCTNKFTVNGVKVPCMYCKACRINKITMWTVRILAEMTKKPKNAFITLTYNNENLQFEDSIATLRKRHLQLFMKKLRKEFEGTDIKFKYFACGEYGETLKRPHYHIIMLGASISDLKKIRTIYSEHKTQEWYGVEQVWGKGTVYYGSVTPASIRYVLGYIMDKEAPEEYEPAEPPFQISSNLFGQEMIDENLEELAKRGTFKFKGKDIVIPKFIRDYYGFGKIKPEVTNPYLKSLLAYKRGKAESGLTGNAVEQYNALKEEQKRYHTEQKLNWKEEKSEGRQRGYN